MTTTHTEAVAADGAGAPAAVRSQFVRFAFWKLRPAWNELGPEAQRAAALEFQELLQHWAERCMLTTYSLVGLRGDVDFMTWFASEELDDLHEFGRAFAQTAVGRLADQPHSFLSMTRHSMYVKNHRETRPVGHRLKLTPGDRRYLFVYPFVKTRAWYVLPLEQRQEMMNEHIRVGNRFPSVRLNTTYSFGLDDQEFVLAFETDEAKDFVDLVMALRETAASAHTLRDTPMFTCRRATPAEIMAGVGVPMTGSTAHNS